MDLAGSLEPLAAAVAALDGMEPAYVHRVRVLAVAVARALRLPGDDVRAIELAAILKDVGKLGVPTHISSQGSPLTREEFQAIRDHPRLGAALLAASPLPGDVAALVLHHHERWDGRGYPDGLRETAIPLGARILSVVDYFCALTTDTPGGRALTESDALALLRRESGQALEPAVVEAFAAVLARPAATPELAAGNAALRDACARVAAANREVRVLHDIARGLGTTLGVAETMALVASKLPPLVPFSACALFLFDAKSDALSCAFATGAEAESIRRIQVRAGQGVTGWVARNRRSLVNARPAADLEAAGLAAGTDLQSALAAPLVSNDRLVGTIAAYHTEPSRYEDVHLRLLERVCEHAAAVIHNAIVFERTETHALTDDLTELPNSRFMYMHLTRELVRAERLKSEVSLIVLDLDGFKRFNQQSGFRAGDRALRAVADALRPHVRPHDLCVRWMSDKFLVILSGAGPGEAQARARALRDAVARTALDAMPAGLRLTASTGTATFPHDAADWNGLLDAGVGRMQMQKRANRSPGPVV